MTSQNFCYWLQGYLEIREEKNISEAQVKIIKEHLALVWAKDEGPDAFVLSGSFCYPDEKITSTC